MIYVRDKVGWRWFTKSHRASLINLSNGSLPRGILFFFFANFYPKKVPLKKVNRFNFEAQLSINNGYYQDFEGVA